MNQSDIEDDDNKNGEGRKEGFKQSFKRRTLQIFFEMMKERNVDFLTALVVMAIHYCQIFGLLYYDKINFPFHDDLYPTICGLADIIRIYPAIEKAHSAILYFALAFRYIFFLVVYVLAAIFVDYSLKTGKFPFVFPVKLLRFTSLLLFWAEIMPVIETFLSIFSCPGGYHVVDLTMECWTGLHILYAGLFSAALLGYIVVFLMVSCFFNESRPYHTDSFARIDTNMEIHMALYKVLITVVGHFVTSEPLHWLVIIIHILGSLYFCKQYLKYLPYYNPVISILFGSGAFIYFWLSVNILLLKALDSVTYQGQSIVILVGVVLIFPATWQVRNHEIEKKLFERKHDKIKSEYELDIYIHKLTRLMIDQHVNPVDEMLLLGVVHNHQSECLSNECPLNNQDELYLPLSDSSTDRSQIFSKDPILLSHLINSIYAEYAKSSNASAVLHTTYAYFLFYQIGNMHMALLELNVAEK